MRCYALRSSGLSQDSPKPNETFGETGDEILPPDLGGPAELGQTHFDVSAGEPAVTKKFRAPGIPVEPTTKCLVAQPVVPVGPWVV